MIPSALLKVSFCLRFFGRYPKSRQLVLMCGSGDLQHAVNVPRKGFVPEKRTTCHSVWVRADYGFLQTCTAIWCSGNPPLELMQDQLKAYGITFGMIHIRIFIS